jgi:tetratricopeptide (TPR) repeat protein
VAASGARSLFVLAPFHFTHENVARLLENHFIVGGDDVLRLHRQYLRAARGAATATGSGVCDAAAVFAYVGRPRQLLQRDGIHLTDTGHEVLAATLADLIVRNYLGGAAQTADRTAPNALAAAPALAAVARHEAAQGQWAEAVVTHRRAVAAAPAALGPRLGLAWLLATCPVDSVRDGTEALELLRPVADPESKLVQYFDVAAAASAEVGQFDQAVAQAGRALELAANGRASDAADSPLVRELRTRLSLYESGRPYRLPGTPADGQ